MNRSSRMRPPHLLAITLLFAPLAWGQSESVAIHPCVVKGGAASTAKKLQEVCTQAMSAGEGLKATEGSCARSKNANELTSCLGRLAKDNQASRSVLVTLTLQQGNKVGFSGIAVDPKGQKLDKKDIAPQSPKAGQSVQDLVQTTVGELRKQLVPAPQAPPVTPATSDAPIAKVEPAPPAAQQPQGSGDVGSSASGSGTQGAVTTGPTAKPDLVPSVTETQKSAESRTWKTPVAYAAGGVGLAAGVLAVVFAIQAGNAYDKLDAEYQNGAAPPPSRAAEVAGLRDDINRNRTLAGVSAGVGAVLVGAGAYLWFSDKPSETKTPGTASLSVGPGGVGLRVLLP
ncbi:hypothetical protein [Vitiosangium sp. GDMCC 1.1324]|uniref:hypothetical protein n=1 Tax=Vitiosangium sp. (strain GDMCC 1.1324) TaxID=2138576 RepID=UPI000D380389|nr:hypothetical protein [Vitiosangium sp. GDMCC 1.1324]PTL83674.1 hypothetical protein DAT35_09330 [Vitiosangium sp. GDMCC 1.1324]